jgi:hypothetical protein
MRIHNWCKKLSTALVAGGLLLPSAVHAAGLGVNLVVNGGFETVDLNVTGEYNSPLVLGWTGPNLFAYSHNGSASAAGVVPDYADGADPPGAGNWYFTNNNTGGAAFTDVRDPNTYFQNIDLSAGATAAAIAAGTATYGLSAYMSSYLNDADYGNVRVDFLDSASTLISTVGINDAADAGPNNVWNLTSATGSIPTNTASVRLSLFGTHGGIGGGGADGYTDNVSFVVNAIPEPSSLALAGLGLAGVGLARRKRRDG